MTAYLNNVFLRNDRKAVVILDQTLLPGEVRYIELVTAEQMYAAIQELKVRGAPAIGICAAYCLYVLAGQIAREKDFRQRFSAYGAYLATSRPTAINLAWAIRRMQAVVDNHADLDGERLLPLLYLECTAIQEEDIAMCRAIAENGLSLLKPGMGILTHCNAGPLATSRYGTALGPILLAKERGFDLHVFADETRPLLQGARLTTFELCRADVDVTLICDNMASLVMKNGWVHICFVGCDRVAMNGDVANKIGTSNVAILAKYYGIPFYVLGPSSTVDENCPTGADIPIELRDGEEIRSKFYQQPVAPAGIRCYNPAFDVTDHELISGIITEKGILRPPFGPALRCLKQGNKS